MKDSSRYCKILIAASILYVLNFCSNNIYAQTVTAQLVGHGLTDTFTYQNKSMPHYSIYWTTDTWYPSGGAVWISSYGGVKFFSGGHYRMGINHAGNVGIGTESPQSLLSVNGTITTKEVNVSTAATAWPDYVFTPAYKLISLDSLSRHLRETGRLPGMPSAEEIGTNGLNLGEMNKLQQQKIEELTLYLIGQNKQLNDQTSKIKEQGELIHALETEKIRNENQQREIDELKKEVGMLLKRIE